MGEADSVKAQRLANETNEKLADKANQLTRDLFDAQNQWNLERRDEEWKYNEPSAQMERYIKSGINPMYALGNVSAGTAQQLTSAQPGAVQMAHVEPEYDTQLGAKISAIKGIGDTVMNGLQGFYKLALENRDVSTRERAQLSQEALNSADAMYKRSQTSGQDIFNKLNAATFEAQVSTKIAQLDQIRSQIKNTDEQSNLYKAQISNLDETKSQIRAMVKYIGAQTDSAIEATKQGWRKLAIEQQNADTNTHNSYVTGFYQNENLKLNKDKFKFDVESFIQEYKQKSNSQLVQFLEGQQTWIDKFLPGVGMQIKENLTQSDNFERVNAEIDRAHYVGTILRSRLEENPTDDNLKAYQKYVQFVDSLPSPPPVQRDPEVYDIANPSEKW